MSVPESLNPKNLLDAAWPGDITLGEVRRAMVLSPVLLKLAAANPRKDGQPRVLRVRFVRERLIHGPEDLPDELTLEELRAGAADGVFKIIIEDDDGGLGVKPRVPELV